MEINSTALLVALVAIWIAVAAGTYQRIFEMPKWFADPPRSFELIRRQSTRARMFWIPLSVIYVASACAALALNWRYPGTRTHIIGSLICFGLTGLLSGVYFAKEVIAFTKILPGEPATPQLLKRVKTWLRWTIVRDLLQLFSALFLTIAYIHL